MQLSDYSKMEKNEKMTETFYKKNKAEVNNFYML